MWDWHHQRRLERLEKKVDQIMAAIVDLKPVLDGIVADVGTIGTGVSSILSLLATLQNTSTSTLSADDQAALNAAVDEANGIKNTLDGINTQVNPVVAPPAQPPTP